MQGRRHTNTALRKNWTSSAPGNPGNQSGRSMKDKLSQNRGEDEDDQLTGAKDCNTEDYNGGTSGAAGRSKEETGTRERREG
ncbi:hypothetical protein F2P79_002693 [Pimephales promelas]|nr:hypothetical protein F2P79_002693 [Pimephales promelas]